MLQLPVTKQGRYRLTVWQDRLTTFDAAQQCIFLSCKHHTDDPCRHKLIVREVQLWPEYNLNFIHEGFDRPPAMLTVKVKGILASVTPNDKMRVLGCVQRGDAANRNAYQPDDPRTAPAGSLHKTDATRPKKQQQPPLATMMTASLAASHAYRTADISAPAPPSLAGEKADWILRCPSAYALEELMAALYTLQPPETEAAPRTVSSPLRVVGDIAVVQRALASKETGTEQPTRNELKF